AADHRLLPDGEADAAAVLQSEARLLVREAELLGLGPYRRDLGRRPTRPHELDGGVEILAAALICVDQGPRRVPDREAAVVARAVTHVRLQDVVVHRVAGPQDPV